MRRRIGIQLLLGLCAGVVLWLLTSPVAYADNCGSIQDCYYTIDAAVKAAIATVIIIGGALGLGPILRLLRITTEETPKPVSETKEEAGPCWSKLEFLKGMAEGGAKIAGGMALASLSAPASVAVATGLKLRSIYEAYYEGGGGGWGFLNAINQVNPVYLVILLFTPALDAVVDLFNLIPAGHVRNTAFATAFEHCKSLSILISSLVEPFISPEAPLPQDGEPREREENTSKADERQPTDRVKTSPPIGIGAHSLDAEENAIDHDPRTENEQDENVAKRWPVHFEGLTEIIGSCSLERLSW